MNALIVHSDEEYLHVVEEFPNQEIFASNFSCYVKYKNQGLHYLFDIEADKDTPKDINYLSLNWYRDSSGIDIFAVGGISLAPAITRRIISSFSNDYRNFSAFKQIFNKFNHIYLSSKSPDSFKRVADVFEKKIKWFDYED